ncbi:hypothetical protein JYQ62_27205 [Nostoc sp. UHCC 0702]|nr:hypothetical protein JYQ62_27205 [Nostoc sp. UHCC 0702]
MVSLSEPSSTNFRRDKPKKHRKINEINYRSNSESDYTERIQELEQHFNYDDNKDYYWTHPEQSLLYGTPLYEQASTTQKKALNHLYWAIQNNNTAASEVNTIIYNQVTSGVFENVGGYDTLCQELQLETSQEYHHIHAFQRIGHKTRTALLGKKGFGSVTKLRPQELKTERSPTATLQDKTLDFLSKNILKKQKYVSSNKFLQELLQKGELFPTPTQGSGGRFASPSLLKFFTINWGSSPFLACHYYALRYISNALLKSQEHPRSLYFKSLERQGEFIPAPTAVSHYHFLDESFHTTTSQIISQNMYQDFSKPTAYEKFIANWTVYLAQRNVINYHGGISCGLPARCFRDDEYFMSVIYRILQSHIFGMSSQDALHWMEKCFCQEHEGFHIAKKYHKGFVKDFRSFFGRLEYLWPINREMRLIEASGSMSQGLATSTQAFRQFAQSIA